MIRVLILCVALTATLFASAANALTFQAFAQGDKGLSVWLPEHGVSDFAFDDGATMTMNPGTWKLEGNLTSSDGSHWAITIDYSFLMAGPRLGLPGLTTQGQLEDDADRLNNKWSFRGRTTGLLTALDGDLEGHAFALAHRTPGSDIFAEYDNCPNVEVDLDCNKDLARWVDITDKGHGPILGGSNPVPEPSAALVFGLGTVLASSSIRRRNR